MAVPLSWQAKQNSTPLSRFTVMEAFFSPCAGQQALTSRYPSGMSTP